MSSVKFEDPNVRIADNGFVNFLRHYRQENPELRGRYSVEAALRVWRIFSPFQVYVFTDEGIRKLCRLVGWFLKKNKESRKRQLR